MEERERIRVEPHPRRLQSGAGSSARGASTERRGNDDCGPRDRLRESLRRRPLLLLIRGLQAVAIILIGTAVLAVTHPKAGAVGAALALFLLGVVVHLDYALRGRSILDVRFGTLLILGGGGTFVLGVVRLLA